MGTATTQVTVYAQPDDEAPSVPENLAGVPGTTSVQLSWSTATDNVGVSGYRLYRDGVELVTVSGTTHPDVGLDSSTTYSYEVTALDEWGNESGRSAALLVVTLDAPVLTSLAISPSDAPEITAAE